MCIQHNVKFSCLSRLLLIAAIHSKPSSLPTWLLHSSSSSRYSSFFSFRLLAILLLIYLLTNITLLFKTPERFPQRKNKKFRGAFKGPCDATSSHLLTALLGQLALEHGLLAIPSASPALFWVSNLCSHALPCFSCSCSKNLLFFLSQFFPCCIQVLSQQGSCHFFPSIAYRMWLK